MLARALKCFTSISTECTIGATLDCMESCAGRYISISARTERERERERERDRQTDRQTDKKRKNRKERGIARERAKSEWKWERERRAREVQEREQQETPRESCIHIDLRSLFSADIYNDRELNASLLRLTFNKHSLAPNAPYTSNTTECKVWNKAFLYRESSTSSMPKIHNKIPYFHCRFFLFFSESQRDLRNGSVYV